MSLLQEARENIRRQEEGQQKKGRLAEEEGMKQREADEMCRQIRSQSGRLLSQYGTRTGLRDRALIALTRRITVLPEPLVFKEIPPQAIGKMELRRELNGGGEEQVEVIIVSSNTNLKKSDIRIYVQGIPNHLLLSRNGTGTIGGSWGPFYKRATPDDAAQYQAIINKVRETLEPPTQHAQPH